MFDEKLVTLFPRTRKGMVGLGTAFEDSLVSMWLATGAGDKNQQDFTKALVQTMVPSWTEPLMVTLARERGDAHELASLASEVGGKYFVGFTQGVAAGLKSLFKTIKAPVLKTRMGELKNTKLMRKGSFREKGRLALLRPPVGFPSPAIMVPTGDVRFAQSSQTAEGMLGMSRVGFPSPPLVSCP